MHPEQVLKLRAWARAYLWRIGDYELAEAVDPLAEFAARNGIDTNKAQQILAEEFGR
jgi:hypothetical protein